MQDKNVDKKLAKPSYSLRNCIAKNILNEPETFENPIAGNRKRKLNVKDKVIQPPITLKTPKLNIESSNEILCEMCGTTYSRGWCKHASIQVNKTGKLYSCKICHNNFHSPDTLKQHLQDHTKEDESGYYVGGKKFKRLRFCCEFCPKRYTTETRLNKHLSTHDVEEIYSCLACKSTFHSMRYLKDHTCDSQKFSCSTCGECFPSQALLEKHLTIHTPKLFSCHSCTRTFNRSGDMVQHSRQIHKVEIMIL